MIYVFLFIYTDALSSLCLQLNLPRFSLHWLCFIFEQLVFIPLSVQEPGSSRASSASQRRTIKKNYSQGQSLPSRFEILQWIPIPINVLKYRSFVFSTTKKTELMRLQDLRASPFRLLKQLDSGEVVTGKSSDFIYSSHNFKWTTVRNKTKDLRKWIFCIWTSKEYSFSGLCSDLLSVKCSPYTGIKTLSISK